MSFPDVGSAHTSTGYRLVIVCGINLQMQINRTVATKLRGVVQDVQTFGRVGSGDVEAIIIIGLAVTETLVKVCLYTVVSSDIYL